MSIYLIIFILLVIAAAYEFFKGKTQQAIFWGAFGLLAVFLCLRYGQGSDYFGYNINYNLTPSLYQWKLLLSADVHGEAGWYLVNSIFRTFKIPFEVLVVLISAFELICIYRFINKHCTLKTVGLFLMYPTFFLTYAFSALRQGLVLFFFLGFLFDWYYEKKYCRYIICTLVCAFFHSSALVLLLPFASRLLPLNAKRSVLYAGCAFILGLAMQWIFPLIIPVFKTYIASNISILALLERLVTAALLFLLFHGKLEEKDSSATKTMYQLYLYALIFYLFFAWNSLISSRFTIYFKAFEIAFLCLGMTENASLSQTIGCIPALRFFKVQTKEISLKNLWKKLPRWISGIRMKYIVVAFSFLLTSWMYFKNINAYIQQGSYHSNINVWNYPYFTIFDREEIFEYRDTSYSISYLLNGWKEDVDEE